MLIKLERGILEGKMRIDLVANGALKIASENIEQWFFN